MLFRFTIVVWQAEAEAEFKGVVENFILTGERLFGEYVWGRYDILVMPPSFPYGGMENPCLTFVTPCIVVGDKSLTDVVIHEIVSRAPSFLFYASQVLNILE